MNALDHKAVRRAILLRLYEAYLNDPLRMAEPEFFYEDPAITSANVVVNMHYLYDRKLVEMMLGYAPPMFSAVRITASGIDLVENHYQFNLQFPPRAAELSDSEAAIPYLIERLVAQGDLSPLEGWERKQLLNDIQYLREQLEQPIAEWRREVIDAVLQWIEERNVKADGALPAVTLLQNAIHAAQSTP